MDKLDFVKNILMSAALRGRLPLKLTALKPVLIFMVAIVEALLPYRAPLDWR